MSKTPWLDEAFKCEGMKEIPGKRHNPEIVKMFAESGHAWVQDDETAWCAAFVNAMLARAGVIGTQSLAARSFTNYGTKSAVKAGAIAVFRRGKLAWQGHVAFCTGRIRKGYIEVLGGNQNNAVNTKWYKTQDLLAVRWPPVMAKSRTVRATMGIAGSAIAAGAVDIAKTVQPVASQFDSWDTVKYVAIACAVILAGSVIYYRWQDMKEKGR